MRRNIDSKETRWTRLGFTVNANAIYLSARNVVYKLTIVSTVLRVLVILVVVSYKF